MAYGSGTLFQAGKKGTWYYQAYVDGKQIGPFSAKTSDRRKAQRELDKLLGRRARGEIMHSKRDKETVGDNGRALWDCGYRRCKGSAGNYEQEIWPNHCK